MLNSFLIWPQAAAFIGCLRIDPASRQPKTGRKRKPCVDAHYAGMPGA